MTHPSSRRTVPTYVTETSFVISIRSTKWNLFYCLIYDESFGLFFDYSQTIAANVEHRSDGPSPWTLKITELLDYFPENKVIQMFIFCKKIYRVTLLSDNIWSFVSTKQNEQIFAYKLFFNSSTILAFKDFSIFRYFEIVISKVFKN